MTLGLPFNVAGTLVNNVAFLSALLVLYCWVEERHGKRCPVGNSCPSLVSALSVGTVIYSEVVSVQYSCFASF